MGKQGTKKVLEKSKPPVSTRNGKRASTIAALSSDDELFDTDEEKEVPQKQTKKKVKAVFPNPSDLQLSSQRVPSSSYDETVNVPLLGGGVAVTIIAPEPNRVSSKPPKRKLATTEEVVAAATGEEDTEAIDTVPRNAGQHTPAPEKPSVSSANTRADSVTRVTPTALAMPRSVQRNIPSILGLANEFMEPVIEKFRLRYEEIQLNTGRSAFTFKASILCMASFHDSREVRDLVKPLHTDFLAFGDWEHSSDTQRQVKVSRWHIFMSHMVTTVFLDRPMSCCSRSDLVQLVFNYIYMVLKDHDATTLESDTVDACFLEIYKTVNYVIRYTKLRSNNSGGRGSSYFLTKMNEDFFNYVQDTCFNIFMSAQRSLKLDLSDFHFMSRQSFHDCYDKTNNAIMFPDVRCMALWNCLFVQEYENAGVLYEVNSQTDLFSSEWVRVCEENLPYRNLGELVPPLKPVYNEHGQIFREGPHRLQRLIDAGLRPQHQMCWLVNAAAKKMGLKSYITDIDDEGNMHDNVSPRMISLCVSLYATMDLQWAIPRLRGLLMAFNDTGRKFRFHRNPKTADPDVDPTFLWSTEDLAISLDINEKASHLTSLAHFEVGDPRRSDALKLLDLVAAEDLMTPSIHCVRALTLKGARRAGQNARKSSDVDEARSFENSGGGELLTSTPRHTSVAEDEDDNYPDGITPLSDGHASGANYPKRAKIVEAVGPPKLPLWSRKLPFKENNWLRRSPIRTQEERVADRVEDERIIFFQKMVLTTMAFNPLYGGVVLDFMPRTERMSHATFTSLAQVLILRADESALKGYSNEKLLKMLHETEGKPPVEQL